MTWTLGARLRQARESKGLTLEDVSRAFGRPYSWLSNLETGRRKNMPEPLEIQKLADELGVPMVDLMVAAGYLRPQDLAINRDNPFAPGDPRHEIVERLKQDIDLSNPQHLFALRYVSSGLDLIRVDDRDRVYRVVRPDPIGPIADNFGA